MTRTPVWVKKYLSYATISRYLSFLLGKGGNPYVSKAYIKTKYKCTFCPAPARKRFRQSVDDARQNCPKYVYFSHEFRTFPVTEGNEI